MDWFRLQPQALGTAAELILVVLVIAYLISRSDKSKATRHLSVAVALTGLMTLASFLLYATNFPQPWPSWFAALTYVFPMAALPYSILFAFEFLGDPFPRARSVASKVAFVAASLSILSTVIELVVEGQLGAPLSIVIGAVFVLGYLFNLGVFVAKTVFFTKAGKAPRKAGASESSPTMLTTFLNPTGREARAHRAFSVLFLFPVLHATLVSLRNAGLIEREFANYFTVIIPILAYAAFAIIYVNYTPERTTFKAKLVGMTVVAVLMIVGIIGTVAVSPRSMLPGSGASLPAFTRHVFTPRPDGGMQVTREPFTPIRSDGSRLDLEDDSYVVVALPFLFPFAGSDWDSLLVDSNGAVSFGSEISSEAAKKFGYGLGVFENPTPKIAPAFMDLDPSQGGTVSFMADSASAQVTWDKVPFFGRPGSTTMALRLFRDGSFEFIYGEQEGAITAGVVGFQPGGAHPEPLEVELTSARGGSRIPTGSTAMWNVGRQYRKAVHDRVWLFLVAMLAGVGAVLVVFPMFIERSLVVPLRSLLAGVRRINEGDLDSQIPVHAYDELGVVTLNFNRMMLALSRAQRELKAHADELETKIAERTRDLEKEKRESETQREQAETQRQIAEEALKVVVEQAKQLQELDAMKSKFFANVSHEFRTPLTLTIGPLEDVRSGLYGPLTVEVEGEIDLALRNARRLLRLVTQILDISKLESGQMRPNTSRQNLKDLLSELHLAFKPLAERKRISLQLDLPDGDLVLAFDPDLIEKVFTNLLSNALKYTDSRGAVRISARIDDCVRDSEPVECVAVAIRDSGSGISREELPHIFDRFYQAREGGYRTHPGTGIGLALAKELVELHKGWIEVESELGFGTTFTVFLRIGDEDLDTVKADEKPRLVSRDLAEHIDPDLLVQEESGRGKTDQSVDQSNHDASDDGQDVTTILVVDDNPEFRRLVQKHLRGSYRVVEADNGATALEQARTTLPDLVISDVMMPEMDGLELCEAIKSDPSLEFIPVILLTARAAIEDKLSGLEKGADAYMPKPFDREELRTRVSALIASRKRLRDRIEQRFELHASDVEVESSDEAFLKNLKNAVEAHLDDEDFSVEALANAVGISRGHLHRRLKRLLEKTPSETIRDLRLERANQLLRGRAGSVSEIAYSVGFRSVSHFSRTFKDAFGATPSEVAQAAAEDQ